jgi:hypothetical protein
MLKKSVTVSLDDQWTCDYFELNPLLFEFATSEPVPSLAAWSFDKRRVQEWAAWLRRSLQIAPMEFCQRYHVLIDQAPPNCKLYVNNQLIAVYTVGDDDPPFDLDITDYLTLGENKLECRVECDAGGKFEGVWLQSVPCSDG